MPTLLLMQQRRQSGGTGLGQRLHGADNRADDGETASRPAVQRDQPPTVWRHRIPVTRDRMIRREVGGGAEDVRGQVRDGHRAAVGPTPAPSPTVNYTLRKNDVTMRSQW